MQAWNQFQRLHCRYAADTESASAWIGKAIEPLESEEALDLLERFSLIYDTLYPAKEK